MENLKKTLEELIKKMEDLKDFSLLSKNFKSNIEAEVFKNVEIGILNNLHKANEYQQNVMLNSFRFRYYTEFNDKNLLLKEIRERKLNTILNDV